tara:strand:+ start:869 stop:1162 length:294 start_codon:yes stop_codon:yes gene_type:complete
LTSEYALEAVVHPVPIKVWPVPKPPLVGFRGHPVASVDKPSWTFAHLLSTHERRQAINEDRLLVISHWSCMNRVREKPSTDIRQEHQDGKEKGARSE